MRMRFSQILFAFTITIALLVGLEIVTSSLMPAFGWREYRLTFNVLIILFLAIRLDSPMVPWMILGLQMIHSAFSIEGWALGTLAGLVVLASANYLKELLHLTSAIMTMFTVQLFQVIWFVTVTLVICLKISDFEKFGMILWTFVPGSILLSLISPVLFWILGIIWKIPSEGGPRGVEI
ncbi:MAG TPA: hypothetical protein VNJ08_06360 [Bacteriovoracaceae bacterium]|nr:hypothetical protein [Bacteriovoracaceae bacterium]